jgi:clan AA aspartic protease
MERAEYVLAFAREINSGMRSPPQRGEQIVQPDCERLHLSRASRVCEIAGPSGPRAPFPRQGTAWNSCAVAPAGHRWQHPRMGEVKVTVKLTNAMDLGMQRRGLIQPAEVRSVTVNAVVDTGAVRSCLPVDVMQQLGLRAVRRINAQMANGEVESVEMTEGVDMEILGRLVTEAFLVLGGEVLIGQTALEATDLQVDCNRQCVIPNPDHPNSAIIRIR